jgi:hypothetical protein
MATPLQTIREAYPEYNNVPDQKLAKALYEKFGGGHDEFDFNLELFGKGKRATPFEMGKAEAIGGIQTLGAKIAQELGAEETSKSLQKAAEDRIQSTAERYKREVPSFKDIHSLGNFGTYAYETGAESAAAMIPPVAGGIVGGIFGGPVGAGIGAGAASIPGFTAQNLQEQMSEGKSLKDTSLTKAALTALPQAGLEAVTEGMYLPFVGPAETMLNRLAQRVGKRTAGETVLRGILGATEAGTVGAITESGQQALQMMQANPAKFFEFGPEVRNELLENAFAGGILEAPFGGLKGITGRPKETPPATVNPATNLPGTPPTTAVEPTVSEPITVPPEGNEWLQKNHPQVEAFASTPQQVKVTDEVNPHPEVDAGKTRYYFNENNVDPNRNTPVLYVNPEEARKVDPKASIKFTDVDSSHPITASTLDPKAGSVLADPQINDDAIKAGQQYLQEPAVNVPLTFASLVDKALYAVAKKDDPTSFNIAKDYLTQGLGMSEDEVAAKSKDIETKADDYLKDEKAKIEKGTRLTENEPLMVPRISEEPSIATFPGTVPETIGGIDVNTTDPEAKAKLDDIIAKSPFEISDQAKAKLEQYAPGILDIARDIHLKFFPGLKMKMESNKGLKSGSRLFGSMDPNQLISKGKFTIAVNTDAAYTPQSILRTLFHEFAHVFQFTHLNEVPKDQLRAIIDQYVRESYPDAARRVASYRIFEAISEQNIGKVPTASEIASTLKGRVERGPDGKLVLKGKTASDFDAPYLLSFREWIAEKGANWYMTSDRVPRTALQKVAKNFYDGLRKIYQEISNYLGLKPNQGAFEQLLADLYGKKTSTPVDTSGKQYSIEARAETAAKAAGVPLSGLSGITPETKGKRVTRQKGLIEESIAEERPGYSSMGDRIVSEKHPITEQDIKEYDANPAILNSNMPVPMQSGALFLGSKKPKGLWSKIFDSITGRQEGETHLTAIARNNVAAHIPFLARADLRHVGQTLERMQNAQGRMSGLITSGYLSFDNGEFKFNSKIGGKEIGGLQQLFSKAGIKGERPLQLYAVARREQDLRKKGKSGFGYKDPLTKKPFTDAELQRIIDSTPAHIKEVAENYDLFNKQMVQFAIDTGVIPHEQGEALKTMFYTPFFRLQDAESTNNGTLTIGGELNKLLKNPINISSVLDNKLGVGDMIVEGFYENTFKNYASIINAGLKNVAYRTAGESLLNLKDTSLAQPVGIPGRNTISYRVAGDEKHLQINDVPMFLSLSALSPKQQPQFVQAAATVANWMRTGTVIAPPFQIANMIKGMIDVKIKQGIPILELVSGTIKGIKDAYSHGVSSQAIQAATGFGGFRYGATAEQQASALKGSYAISEGTASGWQRVMGLLHKLENIGDASEMGPRIAVYNYLIKQKDKKGNRLYSNETAAWESVNLQNFSRSGAGGGITGSVLAQLIPMVPFLNARLQGLYRLFEHGTAGAPESFLQRGTMGIPKAIIGRGMMLAAIELCLNSLYGDDDWYKKLSTNDKINNNYVKITDNTIIAVPRGFEYGSVFGAIPALVMDAIRQNESKQLTDGLTQIFMSTFFFNPIPQVVKPLVEIAFNKDTFTGRDIETRADANLPAAERFDENTSEIGKLIGAYVPISGLSPKKADVLLRGYGGTMATTLASVFDGFIASSGVRPMGYFGDPTSFGGILLGNFIGGNRFVKDPELMNSRYLKDFYDMKQNVTELVTSMNHAKERLDFDGLNERVSKHPEAKAIEQELNRIESRITKINTQSRIIRNNPSISSDQKEQSLKVLRDSKNQLAEQAVKFGNQFGYD